MTQFIDFTTVRVDNNLVMTHDTMTFTMRFNPSTDTMMNAVTGAIVPASRPMAGMEIIWQNPLNIVIAPDGVTNVPYREYGGVVTVVDELDDFPNLVYQVQCESYVHWLDKHLVVGYYNQGHPETIIKQILNDYTSGFTTYNVQNTNVTVVPQYFDYSKVSQAIKTISDQLQYGFYCDYWRDIHFAAGESFVTPLPGNTLYADVNTTVGDLQLREDAKQQANKFIIKGFKTRSQNFMILTYVGDATSTNPGTTQWSTGYRISSAAGDVAVQVYATKADFDADTSFKSGGAPTKGVSMTVKKDVLDGAPSQQGANNTAYIHYTQHLIRIPNYNNSGPVPAGYIIAVRFYYLVDAIWLASDPQAQNRTAQIEGGDGVYEGVHSDKSLTNSTISAVQSAGQLLLQKYGLPQITGKFNAYMNVTSTSGYRAGQYFQLISNRRFGGNFNQTMYILQVTKTIVKNDVNGLVLLYQVQFANSPYLV